MTPEQIQQSDFAGRGDALLALLLDPDPLVRSAAAVRCGQLMADPDVGLPGDRPLLAELARCDARFPGVADAFWATVRYDYCAVDPDNETLALLTDVTWDDVDAWMLGVLLARRGARPLGPVPGNDLEFHAHEAFDDDADALAQLLAAGYTNTVEWALDHKALPREPMIELLTALLARTGQAYLREALALSYGIVETPTTWPQVQLADISAIHITRDYAARRLWTVHWLFPRSPAAVPLAEDLLLTLLCGCLPLDPEEIPLDPTTIRHIVFPDIQATRRFTAHPRRDLQVDLALDAADSTLALRVVRARHPRTP